MRSPAEFIEEYQPLVAALINGDDACVFASGSIVEGLGNSASDFDVFVCEQSGAGVGAAELTLGDGHYLDVERYQIQDLSELAAEVNGYRAGAAPISHAKIDLYYRTAIGVPMVNEALFTTVLSKHFDKTVACQAFEGRCQLELSLAGRRLRVATALRDDLEAVLAARSAFEWCVDGFLASQGEGYPSRKWRFEKFGRLGAAVEEWRRRAWLLKGPGERSASAYVQEVGAFCVELMGVDLLDVSNDASFTESTELPSQGSFERVFVRGEPYLIGLSDDSLYSLTPAESEGWDALKAQAVHGPEALSPRQRSALYALRTGFSVATGKASEGRSDR